MQRVVRGLSVLLHEHLHSNLINISLMSNSAILTLAPS